MTTVHTTDAPAAIGPYSQAKIVGNFVFASGQIPVNPATGAVESEDIEGQDHLLPRRHERLRGLQCGLRAVLQLEAGTQLCRRQDPAEGRAL